MDVLHIIGPSSLVLCLAEYSFSNSLLKLYAIGIRELLPDQQQQPAGDSHDRFAGPDSPLELLEYLAPVGIRAHCGPGDIAHRGTYFAPAVFGGLALPAAPVDVARVVAQPRIADELAGGPEPRDIADG